MQVYLNITVKINKLQRKHSSHDTTSAFKFGHKQLLQVKPAGCKYPSCCATFFLFIITLFLSEHSECLSMKLQIFEYNTLMLLYMISKKLFYKCYNQSFF